ncbi:MAG: GTP 3',8-cyclase MoaA [Sphingomicrobium sp.]
MIDPFQRSITYLRLSVTDRCDLRCTYCMPQRMTFLPRAEVLSADELTRLARAFVRKGIRKIRLTGGEPLVRRDILSIVQSLGTLRRGGSLDELTLTTNGTRLADYAAELRASGIERVNVSLDSLDPDLYREVTRGGDLATTIRAIDAAIAAGLKIKLNAVALRRTPDRDFVDLVEWAHARGAEISFIEVMPLGSVEAQRVDQHRPMAEVRRALERRWLLTDTTRSTGGPARYARTNDGGLIGFITPLSNNFCASCNRVRVTCTGEMFMCLGNSASADLRSAMRSTPDDGLLEATIDSAIARKALRHDFAIAPDLAPDIVRHMSVTGG